MDLRTTEMAALGRPLHPGMLYDCRSDSFIPGVTLWDKKALREDLDVHRQPETNLEWCTSDSLSDKANLMDVSSSLKASFLGGLVSVGGSAKSLHDTKSSCQSRVTMHYSQTTRFEQLTMAELGKVAYPQVFDQHTATHVVTGVLYGAQAFIVFDHMAADHEDQQQVKENLNAIIKKIPCYCQDGEKALKMSESEKSMIENIRVTFHGDCELEENPTTYTEALKVFQKLPHVLRDGDVPVKVWLYPLRLLNEKAAILVRDISEGLVSKSEHLLEALGEAKGRCSHLAGNQRVEDFPDLKSRLQMFQDLISDYRTALQKTLFRILPAIRAGTQEEKVLADILNTQYQSAFAPNNLNKWLDDFTTELNILNSYISGLKDLRVVPSLSLLNSIFFDPAVDVVVCLSFTSLKTKDTYLDVLNDYLNSEAFRKQEFTNIVAYSLPVTQQWFTSVDISKNMRQNLSLFTSFSKANKTEKTMQFIITSISDPSTPGTTIQLYEKGKLIDPKFQPVSKPPLPIMETKDGAVTLKLQKSPTGETVRFRVEYMMIKAGETKQGEEWESTDTPDVRKPFILTGMQPGNQYRVRYKAVGVVGVSEASDAVRAVVQVSCTVIPPDQTPAAPCAEPQRAPAVITDECLNPCTQVGGNGGSETLFLTRDIGGSLRTIRVTLGQNTVDNMQVTLSNNQAKEFGMPKGSPYQDFTFQDGDRFRSLTLWPNRAGDRLGGIVFDVERKCGQVLTFSAKIPNLGNPVCVDVGSGVCCGVKVRSGSDIDASGFFFLKKGMA